MNAILAWLKSKNLSSHSVAAAAVIVATAITTNETVRDFVLSLFQQHPKIGTMIVTLAGIVLKYSQSSSPAGTVASAQTIAAGPNSPTQTAVDAAKASISAPKEQPKP